jgi:hypothetical protein
MKVLDRFTGRQLDTLPSDLTPGRYSLLDRLVVNGHELQAGGLLLDDGSGAIRLENAGHAFIELSDQDEENGKLVAVAAEAIMTIAGKVADGNRNISPMLPSEIAAQCELKELERSVAEVLEEGHLQFISDQPRMDLRYDNWVVPVARARRLATSALTHLASHSDCWQQRTLSGVLPRKILARFSEDDYAIYENRLYKRLLDKLDRYLSGRIEEIQELNLQLEEALDFEDPDKTHFRLRRDICRLWGEAYQDDKTGIQLKAGKETLAELQKQWRRIRSLKQYTQGLYSRVPANAAVPTEIHRTDIFNHDLHYRHLPPLWEMLQINQKDQQLTREERLAQHQKLQSSYSDYIGLVLKRALERDRYECSIEEGQLSFSGAGKQFIVQRDHLDWTISDTRDGSLYLRLIPVAWFGDTLEDEEPLDQDRVICWPGNKASHTSSQYLRISPMDLYVVEKMGRLIDEWLLRPLVKGYGRRLGPLPTRVKQLTDDWPEQFNSVSPTHVQLMKPLDDEQVSQLTNLLGEFASPQVAEMIDSAIRQIGALSRLCGHEARFSPNPPEDFYCQCPNCQTTWGLRTTAEGKFFSMRPSNATATPADRGFAWAGRDWLDIKIDTGTPHG